MLNGWSLQAKRSGPRDLPTAVMLGSPENRSDGKVQRATNRTIGALDADAEILEDNPSFSGARSAVELAWRALDLDELIEFQRYPLLEKSR